MLCCNAALAGKSYCAEHYAVVYNTGSALRKRKKDLRRVKAIQDLQQMILDIAEELEDEGWTPEQDRMFAEWGWWDSGAGRPWSVSGGTRGIYSIVL